MPKVTLVFALLLVGLGLLGYLGTGSRHPTALILAAFGLLLGIFVALIYSRALGWALLVLGMLGFVAAFFQRPFSIGEPIFSLAVAGIGALGVFLPEKSRSKVFMHINVAVGLVGLIGAAAEVGRSYAGAVAKGLAPDPIALAAKLAMVGLLLIYVIFCVRSFIQVRRSR